MAEVLVPGGSIAVDRDVPLRVDDGVVLRADVFRTAAPGLALSDTRHPGVF